MAITRDEALKRLTELKDSGDPEDAHFDADQVLLALIGDDIVREAYNAIEKWYA